MNRIPHWLFAVILFGGLSLAPSLADAGEPTYLILRGHGGASHRYVQPQPYAYGWFGAAPRRSFRAKHHGFYGNYSQWMLR